MQVAIRVKELELEHCLLASQRWSQNLAEYVNKFVSMCLFGVRAGASL